jgi:uncharacterized membrane protein
MVTRKPVIRTRRFLNLTVSPLRPPGSVARAHNSEVLVSSAPIPDVARDNIRAIRDLEAEVALRRTRADRLTDAVSRFAGSFQFLFAQAAVFLGWVGINLALAPSGRAFDPFPFEFLNFLVGAEAILLSTFVLMTQNRQNRESEQWAHVQLQVGLLAEQEATKMLEMLRLICARLGLDRAADDPELAQMIETTHVEELARELEKAREEGPADVPPGEPKPEPPTPPSG